MAAFELRGVAKQYGGLQALQPLDLTVEAGERLAVIGPSGAGKSTLLRLLNTSLRPSTGEVVVFGEETSRLSDKRLRTIRSRIGTIYQQYLLVPQVSVFQNVIAGRLGKISLWKATWSLLSRNEADRVSRVLESVGLAERIFERVDRLSGGEQQRVAVARLLYQDPEVLVADEPVASVDPSRGAEILSLLGRLAMARTLVVSTHRLDGVLPYVSRVIGIRRGQLLFDKPKAALTVEDIAEVYRSSLGIESTEPRQRYSPLTFAPAGIANLGASNTPGEFLLPRIVPAFVRECPGARVSLTIKCTEGVTSDILNGVVDLGFVGARGDHPSLHYEDFASDEIILVCAKDHPAASRLPLDPAEVGGLHRVERELGSGTRAVVEDHFANLGLPLDPAAIALEVGTLAGLKAAVLSGIGVAFSSRLAVEAELQSGLLQELPIASVKIPRQIFAAWRRDQELPLPARRFLEVARRALTPPAAGNGHAGAGRS
jgi:phosphonate transport system ATP-binding protein